MNIDARVGAAVDGALNPSTAVHSSVVDAGALSLSQKQPPQPRFGTVENLLAGGIAGAFSKTCTAPLARLTILFQLQGMQSEAAVLSKPSLWREASRILNEEGFRAFGKGILLLWLTGFLIRLFVFESSVTELFRNARSSPFVHFVSGGLAGITAASATYPLDLVRAALLHRNAMYYQGIGHAFRTICREEGFLGLYKGLGATMLGVGPTLAINFATYESLKSFWLSHRPDDSTLIISLGCGSLAGVASSTGLLFQALRRKQVEGAGGRARVYNTGLFGTFKHIFKSEGIRGLYRGLLPEYYKVVPGVGITFMIYESLKKLLCPPAP
ncbi:hypothetical protein Bca52824_043055 [Brassica carinata]|uniref:Mitochondrial substrate carrier family protein B n=1 Tax=Brassica carinata TaxID=52824 RepID=A0A8X7V0B8_BRACI|nr:hypothetical protein Bca52824_043055 [Brassica carinata]